MHCTSVYLFSEILYFSTYFHDKKPKKEQLFLFFQPKGFDYELYESLGISQWKHCTLSTFLSHWWSRHFFLLLFYSLSRSCHKKIISLIFFIRSECFFCFFDCFKLKSQIKSLKTLHSGILPCAHTHVWLQHINT